MKKNVFSSLALAAVLATASLSAQAALIGLFDYGFNIDGTVSLPTLGDPVPAAVDISAFDDITGLGSIRITLSGAGAHSVDAFFDHEIDEAINTFFNESGAVSGVAAAGQSWEIDEPGWVTGDIFENFEASALDNGIGTSIYGDTVFPEDVSMALGWDFTLAVDQTALIDLVISETAPLGGLYLTHTDPDSQASIYLSSSLDIRGGGQQIPAPATLLLRAVGLAALGRARYRVVF